MNRIISIVIALMFFPAGTVFAQVTRDERDLSGSGAMPIPKLLK
jgi:hypothetical protein